MDSEGTIHVATVKCGWRLRTRAISKKGEEKKVNFPNIGIRQGQ